MGLDSRAVIHHANPNPLSLHTLSHTGPSRNATTPCRRCQRHSASPACRRRLVLLHGTASSSPHPPRQSRLRAAARQHHLLLNAADSVLPAALPSCRECARPCAESATAAFVAMQHFLWLVVHVHRRSSLPFAPCCSIWNSSAGATADAASPALGVLHAGARRTHLLLCPRSDSPTSNFNHPPRPGLRSLPRVFSLSPRPIFRGLSSSSSSSSSSRCRCRCRCHSSSSTSSSTSSSSNRCYRCRCAHISSLLMPILVSPTTTRGVISA